MPEDPVPVKSKQEIRLVPFLLPDTAPSKLDTWASLTQVSESDQSCDNCIHDTMKQNRCCKCWIIDVSKERKGYHCYWEYDKYDS